MAFFDDIYDPFLYPGLYPEPYQGLYPEPYPEPYPNVDADPDRRSEFPPADRPAEYIRGHGWNKNGRRTRVKKPHYHWIWPKDGKNGSKWGRWKDLCNGSGPDIHITASKNKMDYMQNRQRKAIWANHIDLDDRHHDYFGILDSPWGKKGGRAAQGLKYDFYTRKYRTPDRHMWSDAIWRQGKKAKLPERARRDMAGTWWWNDSHDIQQLLEMEGVPWWI